MAAHSSILAWKIPWIEEPGRLQSMGSQKELDMTQRLNNNHHHKKMMSKNRRQNRIEKNEKKFNKMQGYLILHNIQNRQRMPGLISLVKIKIENRQMKFFKLQIFTFQIQFATFKSIHLKLAENSKSKEFICSGNSRGIQILTRKVCRNH